MIWNEEIIAQLPRELQILGVDVFPTLLGCWQVLPPHLREFHPIMTDTITPHHSDALYQLLSHDIECLFVDLGDAVGLPNGHNTCHLSTLQSFRALRQLNLTLFSENFFTSTVTLPDAIEGLDLILNCDNTIDQLMHLRWPTGLIKLSVRKDNGTAFIDPRQWHQWPHRCTTVMFGGGLILCSAPDLWRHSLHHLIFDCMVSATPWCTTKSLRELVEKEIVVRDIRLPHTLIAYGNAVARYP
jgi:hypothetical protein